MQEKTIQWLLNFSIINLDKPSGPTSFQVSQFVKNSLNITKPSVLVCAGFVRTERNLTTPNSSLKTVDFSRVLKKTSHFGTLDPQVSGVLPIALGRACKLSDYFMHRNKTYVGIMRLHCIISETELKNQIENFIGKIKQLPPVRSRVNRVIREREIKYFKILEIENKDVLFETEVQAGTYIRKLCDDIGKKIGGAHMLELRRTKAGIFSETDANFINLYDFEKVVEEFKNANDEQLKKILIPAEEAIKNVLPTAQIKEKNLSQILTGKPLFKEDFKNKIPEEEKFAAFSEDKFIGVYKKVNEGDVLARAEFVFN